MHSVTAQLELELEKSLRDAYAGEILNGIISPDVIYDTTIHATLTKAIYKLADAMIEARKGGK
jgi:hypothetical protein